MSSKPQTVPSSSSSPLLRIAIEENFHPAKEAGHYQAENELTRDIGVQFNVMERKKAADEGKLHGSEGAKMAITLRSVKVAPISASLDEARHGVLHFFRKGCGSLPSTIEIYNLDDVVTAPQLRSTIASEIRKNSHLTSPRVTMPIFQGNMQSSELQD